MAVIRAAGNLKRNFLTEDESVLVLRAIKVAAYVVMAYMVGPMP